jgi:hypothetical protein
MYKKTKSLGLILSLIFAVSLMPSCEYEFIEPEQVVIPEVISFADNILPIFNAKCSISGCHVSGFAILDLSDANAYTDLFRKDQINRDFPDQSGLYVKLNAAQSTHAGRSTPTEQATILEWIAKGAKNN